MVSVGERNVSCCYSGKQSNLPVWAWSFSLLHKTNSVSFLFAQFSSCLCQTPLRTPETRLEIRPKKRFMCVCNNVTDENVLRPWLDWPMIWILNEFARPSRRTFPATVPSKKMKRLGKSFNFLVINEPMSRTFWWIKKFVMPRILSCTVSKHTHVQKPESSLTCQNTIFLMFDV